MIKDRLTLLDALIPELEKGTKECRLCPRQCRIDRFSGRKGFCGSGIDPVVFSFGPHHGEEPPISGENGSGNIFFSHCTMKCVYCQNFRFSQQGEGKRYSPTELADIFLDLQDRGCHNINLVTPTHYLYGICIALREAILRGLDLPIIYNCGGYEAPDIIRSLEGIVDIYLVDIRYSNDRTALRYSSAPGYISAVENSLNEMIRQVGHFNADNATMRGTMIRLLIMPDRVSGVAENLDHIHRHFAKEACLSLMSQYYPAYHAGDFENISRRPKREEYDEAVAKMMELGFQNGWIQPYDADFDARYAGENFRLTE